MFDDRLKRDDEMPLGDMGNLGEEKKDETMDEEKTPEYYSEIRKEEEKEEPQRITNPDEDVDLGDLFDDENKM
jgi:hypothetical protein